MICDYQTNKVYLAEGIKGYEKVAERLLMRLYDEGIHMDYLPYSASKKHVWARDYMPIQTIDGFVQYVYRPDYLQMDKEYIPRYEAMIKKLELPCQKTRLVLDGGNVVKGENAVIMTDKVLRENALYREGAVIEQLEKLFDCRVCLIPWDRYEMFGHADGMVRFIDRDTVLMNNYADIDKGFRKRLLDALKWHGFGVEELHYDKPRGSKYSWAYLNFLQTKNCIFVPGLGLDEDEKALEQIQAMYQDYKVIQVPGCLELVRDGGALNCVTWNIRTPLSETDDDIPM